MPHPSPSSPRTAVSFSD
uniref:Uncharacterized protein n=1 Tax=Arundo donax TaxID=35708 RepID=A0A0A9BWB1_ARUDO